MMAWTTSGSMTSSCLNAETLLAHMMFGNTWSIIIMMVSNEQPLQKSFSHAERIYHSKRRSSGNQWFEAAGSWWDCVIVLYFSMRESAVISGDERKKTMWQDPSLSFYTAHLIERLDTALPVAKTFQWWEMPQLPRATTYMVSKSKTVPRRQRCFFHKYHTLM